MKVRKVISQTKIKQVKLTKEEQNIYTNFKFKMLNNGEIIVIKEGENKCYL